MSKKNLTTLFSTSIVVFVVALLIMIVTIIIRSSIDYTEPATVENIIVKYTSIISFIGLITSIVSGILLLKKKSN